MKRVNFLWVVLLFSPGATASVRRSTKAAEKSFAAASPIKAEQHVTQVAKLAAAPQGITAQAITRIVQDHRRLGGLAWGIEQPAYLQGLQAIRDVAASKNLNTDALNTLINQVASRAQGAADLALLQRQQGSRFSSRVKRGVNLVKNKVASLVSAVLPRQLLPRSMHLQVVNSKLAEYREQKFNSLSLKEQSQVTSLAIEKGRLEAAEYTGGRGPARLVRLVTPESAKALRGRAQALAVQTTLPGTGTLVVDHVDSTAAREKNRLLDAEAGRLKSIAEKKEARAGAASPRRLRLEGSQRPE